MSASSRSSRNPLRYSSSDSNYRNQALQLLQRSGALKTLIEQLEGQLERSPDSIGLLEQLIEFYGVTGQKEEAGEKLQQAIERRPDSAILRSATGQTFRADREDERGLRSVLGADEIAAGLGDV